MKPDVITLDIHMPELSGVELLRAYLPKNPIPTIMLSALTPSDGPEVLQALELGAVDYVQKPSSTELPLVGPMLREKIKAAATARVQSARGTPSGIRSFSGQIALDTEALVLMGASTGGTEALREVLARLPEQVPPILIVQHIPPVFSKAFAERLNGLCAFEVREAVDGDVLRPGLALVAPGGYQMKVTQAPDGALRVRVEDTAPVNRHKPSVDVLFESATRVTGVKKKLAVLLTGMGADGAKGLLALRNEGAHAIAQDEASSVVFGMPREAIKLGAAKEICSLTEIPRVMQDLLRKKERAA